MSYAFPPLLVRIAEVFRGTSIPWRESVPVQRITLRITQACNRARASRTIDSSWPWKSANALPGRNEGPLIRISTIFTRIASLRRQCSQSPPHLRDSPGASSTRSRQRDAHHDRIRANSFGMKVIVTCCGDSRLFARPVNGRTLSFAHQPHLEHRQHLNSLTIRRSIRSHDVPIGKGAVTMTSWRLGR